ncbi:hypothetical protein [Vibrio sp. SCSIO 43136]|uniref:hypothetical protein n=1 Tax=Vibrio sp. SCSIO 43136 TaxID=2819101 RepID=UPI002075CD0B|nr:hypothetical protein [Vibrio sp. SCSIO 43136]USD67897.1 hypothetical protein J4N39_17075 [Vibrio sp. SCSIO 43136]
MKFLLFLTLLLSFGCSNNMTKPSLYSTYKSYIQQINESNAASVAPKYYDPELLNQIDLNNHRNLFQVLFFVPMKKVDSYAETIHDNYGCLSVNGFEEGGNPMSINIEYNHNSLISDVGVFILESTEDFFTKGTCPNEYEVY